MSVLKNKLQNAFDGLKGLEERARKLKNQNLADIAASAHGRIKQLVDHPDLELVDDRKDQAHPGNPLYVAPTTKDEAIVRMREEGAPDPEAAARANWPYLFEPTLHEGQTPFPGASQSQLGDPSGL